MKISIVGAGYVGLVVAACLAETGNNVVCADVNHNKIANLKRNILPIYGPGLDALVNPKLRRPDISRARAMLGWTPRVGVREGLERTITYFQTERSAILSAEP
jgi:UDPglucose 6-dehydrogenase